MYVLVACEESQTVCKAFRDRGHEAYSCDMFRFSGDHTEWHMDADVQRMLNPTFRGAPEPGIRFITLDDTPHYVPKWDLVVAFPPCTFLSAAGASRLHNGNHLRDSSRYQHGLLARGLFMSIFSADCDKIAIENPVPMKEFNLPAYDQIVNPYMFGDPWKKRTCLWLKGLPKLTATDLVEPVGHWVGNNSKGGHRGRIMRSKTAPGLARAMAEQWG